MAAYADVAHVKARAGYLAGAWGESTTPALSDVLSFLDDVADEIRAAITGLGLTPPEPDTPIGASLRGLNADGALILALDATFPAGEGPEAATELQKAVRARYEKGWDRLIAGKHPAATSATVAADGSTTFATDFWQENPDYGRSFPPWFSGPDGWTLNPALDPSSYRGEPL